MTSDVTVAQEVPARFTETNYSSAAESQRKKIKVGFQKDLDSQRSLWRDTRGLTSCYLSVTSFCVLEGLWTWGSGSHYMLREWEAVHPFQLNNLFRVVAVWSFGTPSVEVIRWGMLACGTWAVEVWNSFFFFFRLPFLFLICNIKIYLRSSLTNIKDWRLWNGGVMVINA